MHEFEEMEQLVLDALEPLKDQGLKTLELYSGQTEMGSIKDLGKITARFPCVYVIATGLSLKNTTQYDEEEIGIMLILGDRNLRKADSPRLGDSTRIGVYALLEQTEILLHRKKICKAGTLFLQKAAPMYLSSKKRICFYSANYRLRMVK